MEHLQRMPEKGCLVRLPLEVNSLNKNNILGNYYSDGILKHFFFFLLELINKYKLLVIKNDWIKNDVKLRQLYYQNSFEFMK